jgi:RHH-type transcriptional regulator, proline utilization regulon repressor / proline dehydrogenase / delta 1-pyrroline-5-carboxylate dehydrogenase
MDQPELAWEEEIQQLGREIFDLMGEETPSVFRKDYWSGKLMEWCMRNPALKVQMFRFVDVLPTLKSARQVGHHVREYFSQPGVELPPSLQWAMETLTGNPITGSLAASQIRRNVQDMASRFIVGASPAKALPRLRQIWDQGMVFTLDLLGEVAVSDEEALAYQARYLELFDELLPEIGRWPVKDARREEDFPRFNISLKLSSLDCQMDPVDFEGCVARMKARLRPIFRKAKEQGAFVNIDMEHFGLRNLTLAIFRSLLEEEEFQQLPRAGIVLQTYLRDWRQDLDGLIQWAQERNRPFTIRLVKGAYWDYEQVLARLNDWPVPVFLDKQESDAAFEEATRICLGLYPLVRVALASHNVRSLAHGIVCARKLGLPPQSYEIQMLYGMAEPIKRAFLQSGFSVCEYAPIGEMLPGMAYLVRRLLENTSNESFLRQSFTEHASVEVLLRRPNPPPPAPPQETPAPEPPKPLAPYRPELMLGFAREETRQRFRQALGTVRDSLGSTFPLWIGGKEERAERELISVNPARPDQVVGRTYLASREEAERAVVAAAKALPAWRETDPGQRAELILRIASNLRSRRRELSALLVYEISKTWREADADVCEAIDFCEYYAREMLRLGRTQHMDPQPGESNVYFYQSRGVALVVGPWNFPLAISTGMVAAALVAGNPVIYKPSSLSPIAGAMLSRAIREAGVPTGVFQYLPCSGSEVGPWLVEHPQIALVAFTGSREVGLDILQRASALRTGQTMVKRVLAEMGGKNAIIVDADADLDAAVVGVLQSAFGFQGQKCSACSRVVVLKEAHERFVRRLVEATRSLRVGDPVDPATHVAAVIDAQAHKKILEYIEIGKSEGTLLFQAEAPKEGFFVGPTIFDGIRSHHRIAQEEIFGPVLAVMGASNLDEALEVANGTPYALTGGLYSRSPANIERVKREFQVGNLYINRKITGAIVGRQPFGGLGMSGIGSKTGGPDYLIQFMEPRTVTENTLRRGFAPEMEG